MVNAVTTAATLRVVANGAVVAVTALTTPTTRERARVVAVGPPGRAWGTPPVVLPSPPPPPPLPTRRLWQRCHRDIPGRRVRDRGRGVPVADARMHVCSVRLFLHAPDALLPRTESGPNTKSVSPRVPWRQGPGAILTKAGGASSHRNSLTPRDSPPSPSTHHAWSSAPPASYLAPVPDAACVPPARAPTPPSAACIVILGAPPCLPLPPRSAAASSLLAAATWP